MHLCLSLNPVGVKVLTALAMMFYHSQEGEIAFEIKCSLGEGGWRREEIEHSMCMCGGGLRIVWAKYLPIAHTGYILTNTL